ncbi:hypothetical protein M3Y94_00300600 [Aphelenchoides besseyi]|nr:hypothetical protein M3Y94_00300600 [Aphelenchoides besseyi]
MLKSQNRSCMENGGRLLVNECPPKITHAVVFQNEFQIVMENVEQFKNLHVQICDNEVTFERKKSLLKGFLDGIDYNPGCDVVVYGDLQSASDFALRWLSETDSPTTSSMPSSNKARVTRFIVGISAAVVIAILIALIAYTTCYLQKDRTKSADVELPMPPHAYKSLSTTETGSLRGLSSIPTFSREMFQTVRNLGKGHFGRVDLCNVNHNAIAQRQVAIKKIPDHIDNMDIVLQEVELIGQCAHENIVKCLGYYFEVGYVCVVMEYMAGGDLHKYLTGPTEFTMGDALSFIEQIVCGMEYLANKAMVHRDLAARNCVLSENVKIVKITDFGLCRKANSGVEYLQSNDSTQLPQRWTAVECLMTNHPTFSEKTDVWSFGVVMWEVFSRAGQPYPDIQVLPEVASYLNAGNRLKSPGTGCPDQIYKLMCSCWLSDPFKRPTFRELHQQLINITYELDQTEDDYRSVYLEPLPVSNAPSVVMPSRGSQVSTPSTDKTLTE